VATCERILVTRSTFVTFLCAPAMIVFVGGAGASVEAGVHTPAGCSPARVQYAPHPRIDGTLSRLPWVRGKPLGVGLVGLLWYWSTEWRQQGVRTARIFTGGQAPAGYSTKILWSFMGRSALGGGGPRLLVRGSRLDATATFSQEFAAISFTGERGPSFASIVDVPEPGCWRLDLSTGGLRGSVVLLAVAPSG